MSWCPLVSNVPVRVMSQVCHIPWGVLILDVSCPMSRVLWCLWVVVSKVHCGQHGSSPRCATFQVCHAKSALRSRCVVSVGLSCSKCVMSQVRYFPGVMSKGVLCLCVWFPWVCPVTGVVSPCLSSSRCHVPSCIELLGVSCSPRCVMSLLVIFLGMSCYGCYATGLLMP